MLGRAGIVGVLLTFLLAFARPAFAEGPFEDWAAVVVAGDFHGSGGGATEAFDNARRDISKELQRLGFALRDEARLAVALEVRHLLAEEGGIAGLGRDGRLGARQGPQHRKHGRAGHQGKDQPDQHGHCLAQAPGPAHVTIRRHKVTRRVRH